MSTVAKLDTNVRWRRSLRRTQLREMGSDLGTISKLIDHGHKIARAGFTTLPAQTTHRRIMADMILKRAVLEMTMKHLTKVFRDPSRTGERKEAIFTKLNSPQSDGSGDANET